MGQVFWQLRILFSIAAILSVIPGSSGFSVQLSPEPSTFIPTVDAQAPSSILEPGLSPNGSILHPLVVSPPIKSPPPQHQTINGPPPMVSPSESMEPPPEQPPHGSSPPPSAEPPHGSAPSWATVPLHDSTPPHVSQRPVEEPPFLASPPPMAEPPPPFLASPPPTAEPPPPLVASPLLTVEPPPPFVASPPLMLPLPAEPPPLLASPPIVADPPPPFLASPPLTVEPPQPLLASPPLTAEPPPHGSASSRAIVPSHDSTPPHVSQPPVDEPPFLASPPPTAEPPPPFVASPLPTAEPPPPFVASPLLALPHPAEPPPLLASPPVVTDAPPPFLASPPRTAEPPQPVLASPPLTAEPPPHGSAPSRATVPSHDSTPPLVSQPPVEEPPFLASPPLTAEPPPSFLASPPPMIEPPPPFLASPPPTTEPPPPLLASPLLAAKPPPPPFVASPPLMLPLPVEPPPFLASPPFVHSPPPFLASPPLTAEPPQPLLASPPLTAGPPPPMLASPPLMAEPPPPFLASPLPTTEPPPPYLASPPFMLPLRAEPPPFVVSSTPAAEPPYSTLPLAEKPPEVVSPLPVAEPPKGSTVGPPLSSHPHAMSPGQPHSSDIGSAPDPPNASSPLPQPIPSRASPPIFRLPSHPLVPSPLVVPPSTEPPPPFLASSPLMAEPPPPPLLASPPFTAEAPPPFLASPPLTAEVPPPFLASPPPTTEPPPPFLASPPFTASPPPQFFTSPPPTTEPPPPFLASSPSTADPPPPPLLASPSLTAEPPPPFLTSPPLMAETPPPILAPPPLTVEPPPPFLASPPLTIEPSPPFLASPPPSYVPPHASATQSPPEPPHESSPLPQPVPPHTSPATTSVPPPLARPPPPTPIVLPHTFPPPSSTMPGALPPNASSPPPAMEGTVSAVPPHASEGKETHNGASLPMPVSPEPSPSSRTSSGGVPPVHHIMPRSHPPISHQIEAPKYGAQNVSGFVPNIAPSEPKHDSAPLTSLVPPPPSVGSYYSPRRSPVKGTPPFLSPSTHKSTMPTSFSPMHPVLPPRSNASEGSQSSASSPSSDSIHKQIHPRDKVKTPAPSSDHLTPPPAPSQQGQAEIPVHAYAPRSMPVGRQKYHRQSPLGQGIPEISPAPSFLKAPDGHSGIPFLSPKISPSGSSTRNKKRSLAPPIRALPPPPPNQDCAYLTCPEPFTNTPPGSPCGCVWPMQVGLRLSVALYTFFPLVSELAREIAAGVFMKQSQVRVMGANATSQSPEKTIVLVDLVPLDDKFDNVTAFLTTQRFWRKQVSIDTSIFGDYDVLYVHYPGLPPSPPMAPADIAVINSMPYSVGDPNGNKMHPLGVDVPKQKNNHKLNGILIAVIVFSATIGVLICCAVAWVLIFRHTSHNSQTTQTPRALTSLARSSGPMGQSTGSGPSSSLSFGSSLAPYTGSAKTFSASEIEKATDNLNPARILGEGGFGLVYSGVLEDETSIAVKVLKRDDQQGGREFLAEVEMLSRLHHRNLVKLIGICTDERLRCLVYELIPNGSVESHLHGIDKETAPLDWASRLKIALGAARGLAYLHEDSSPRVIHRDFKSSNILLENNFTPKVSDFGLARIAMDEENRHISTRVMGTFGYVAPEYAMTGHLLVKSDVYSYGVVLLELLTGRKPVDMSQPPGQENLVNWTRPLLTSKEGLESIIDSSLGSDVPYESVAKVAAIASMCVQPEVSNRPFMGEVVQALKLVCNECDESKDGNDSRSHSGENLSMDYFDAKAGPLLDETPDPIQTRDPLHGYLPGDDLEKGLSVSEVFSVSARLGGRQASGSFRRHSASGPLRTAWGPRFWQRVRRPSQQGSMSEHGIMYRLWASSH